jgi:chemotaxis protein CheD
MELYPSGRRARPRNRVRVGISDFAVTTRDADLVTSGLGSCIAIAVFDPHDVVAGLAHALLPTPQTASTGTTSPASKFANTAVAALLDEMYAAGASPDDTRAKLAGGSRMFEFSASEGVGRRNVEAARAALADRGVPVVATDVGGDYGRSVRLRGSDGEFVVRSAVSGDRTL